MLVLDLPDSFARLLVHGLAQFHSLRSSTGMQDGGKVVVLQQQVSGAARQSSSSSSPVRGESMQETVGQGSPQQVQQSTSTPADWQQGEKEQQQRGAVAAGCDAPSEELMCSDVIAVLQQFGSSLNHNSLRSYVSSLGHDDDGDAPAGPPHHAGDGLADE